jgi:hypothetical protein
MEHRLGARRAVRAPVVLHPHIGAAVLGHSREVSISGMFVEAPAMLLAAHEVIHVEMTLPATAGLHTFRWQAMVIRKTASGVGLMFDRLRPPAINRLLANVDAGLAVAPPVAPASVAPLKSAAERAASPL